MGAAKKCNQDVSKCKVVAVEEGSRKPLGLSSMVRSMTDPSTTKDRLTSGSRDRRI